MSLRQRLLTPVSVVVAIVQWVAVGLIIQLQLALAFALLKPVIRDRVGWSYLALALGLLALDVVLFLRLPEELANSRSLARRLLRLGD